nr:carboxypeptidase-like regulatory domain-containing protein [uncultured Roseateles sp.]
MHLVIARTSLAVLASYLAGCCVLGPSHPATSLAGVVRNSNGTPIANAKVVLYGSSNITDANGCFKMHFADALPFTFGVVAAGYKSAEIKAKPGFYRVQAELVATQSGESSRIEWRAISGDEYNLSSSCKS